MPIAQDFGFGSRHQLQRGDGFLRVEFLIEANRSVEHHNDQNCEGFNRLAQNTDDDARRNQDPDHKAVELINKDPQRADSLPLFQLIGTIRYSPLRSGRVRQSGWSRRQTSTDLIT